MNDALSSSTHLHVQKHIVVLQVLVDDVVH